MLRRLFVFLFIFLGAGFLCKDALAAKLYLVIDKPNAAIGEEVNVDVRIDSEGAGVNAVQATFKYPKDSLSATGVGKSGSVINFWVDDPSFDNNRGEVTFTGGSSDGLNGKTLQVMRTTFKVIGGGLSELVFTDGAVSAADGSGTNVLSSMIGAQINSAPSSGVEAAPAPPAVIVVPEPVQIKRAPVKAAQTPVTPNLVVELYPDTARAYNISSVFSAKWDLPLDISDVATALNTQKGFNPTKSEGLFESKSFKSLEDGIWYLHVRFKNNIGWGATAHYRLMIDTVKPLPFEIKIADGTAADDPTPEILYETADEFSGLSAYTIQVDEKEAATTDKGSYTPEPLGPGKHIIKVVAGDKAGNSVESNLEIDILPIESPVLTSVAKTLFVGEGGLDVAGTGVLGQNILLDLSENSGRHVFSALVKVGSEGNWISKIEESLKKGKYTLSATSQDERGALSLPAIAEINVRERPFLVIGGLELTKAWLLFIVIMILGGGFGFGLWFERTSRRQRANRVIIAQRDVASIFGIIGKDIDTLIAKLEGGLDETELKEMQFVLKRIKDNINKTQRYVLENIEEIKK